jgi:hypothetical protein
MKHLVNSLKFDLHCPLEEQAFDLRAEIAGDLQQLVVAGIEKICDAHISDTDLLRIDKLEIDLGRISAAELKEHFGPQFMQQFEIRLQEYLSRTSQQEQDTAQQDTRMQLFAYFMQTGLLPWWATEAELDFEMLCRDSIRHVPEVVTAFFLQHKNNEELWKRAVHQLDTDFWDFLLSSLPVFQEAGKHMENVTAFFKQKLQQLNDPIVAEVFDELQKLVQDDRVFLVSHAPDFFKAQQQQDFPRVMAELVTAALFPEDKTERALLKAELEKSITKNFNPVQKIAEQNIVPEGKPQYKPEAIISEKLIIHDAGLVLLSPFMKPLFSSLGYWTDGQWTNREAQERAVCLLEFIATGKTQCKEYNLALPKLLCGIPLYQPVQTGMEFTDEEIKETETLLESVIEHWKALKNTSAEGFRSSFLQRDAVLFPRDKDWQLVVEKKTLDILLEGIPWGYGTLSIAWNEYLIFTEW